MATVANEVQDRTKKAQDNAHLQMMTLAKEMHAKLATFPLHTHTNALDMLNIMARNRQQAMQLEAMEQQKKFEEERRIEHEARFKQHNAPTDDKAEGVMEEQVLVPQLVT